MRRIIFIICVASMLTFLSGCFFMPVDDPLPPPPTIFIPTDHPFSTVPVQRGDVIHEVKVSAVQVSSRKEQHYFPADGVTVLGIYVVIGQTVMEGDIIAALDVIELENEHNELNRTREMSALELSQLEERQRIISRQAADAGIKLDNTSFLWTRDTLRLTIAHLDRLIENVEKQKTDMYVRAAMDGVVTNALVYYEGMRSNSNNIVATVSVELVPTFVVTDDAAANMNPGDRFEMTLGKDLYLMVVVDPAELGIDVIYQPPYAYLAFVGTMPGPGFETNGYVHVPVGNVKNVLYIPASLLNRVGGRNFVYVLDNGLRALREVEPGFESDGYIEIISGLSEGELIIQ